MTHTYNIVGSLILIGIILYFKYRQPLKVFGLHFKAWINAKFYPNKINQDFWNETVSASYDLLDKSLNSKKSDLLLKQATEKSFSDEIFNLNLEAIDCLLKKIEYSRQMPSEVILPIHVIKSFRHWMDIYFGPYSELECLYEMLVMHINHKK